MIKHGNSNKGISEENAKWLIDKWKNNESTSRVINDLLTQAREQDSDCSQEQ